MPDGFFSPDPSKNFLDPFIGLGSQYNQGLYSPLSADYGINAENLKKLEDKVKALGSQHVRIFFDPDAHAKPVLNFGIYPDPQYESFRKVVKLAQESGATVNITYWHTPAWQAGEMTRFAKELKYLIEDLGYTCVQYVTVQNEPNETSYITKELYQVFWEQLHAACKDLGIRDKLKFIGGDIIFDALWEPYPTMCREWLAYMGEHMNKMIDGYSVHIYWNFWQFDEAITLLGLAKGYVEAMPEAQRKPLYITEYGIRGYRGTTEKIGNPYFVGPGASKPFDPNAIPVSQMMMNGYQHAMFNIEALRLGYVGLIRWDCYRARYDGTRNMAATSYGLGEGQDFSMIGKGSEDYVLRHSYYQLALMTRAAKPGSIILGTNGASNGQSMVALQSREGELSLFLYHHDSTAKELYIKDLPQKTYYVYSWNKNGDGKITFDGAKTPDKNGFIGVTVSGESFSVMTSFQMDFTNINAF